MKISVIIPVYNGERYLPEAIDSVLAQTQPVNEIIVVNDGSSDASESVAKRYWKQIRYVYQENSGIGQARNTGINLATGTILGFLDADDLWQEDKIKVQTQVLRDDLNCHLVFGLTRQFISPDLPEQEKSKIAVPDKPMPGYLASSMLIRREAFDRVGRFSSAYKLGEFVDWFARCKETGLAHRLVERVLLNRRIHTDNIGRREKSFQSDYARILKAALDRRRKKGSGSDSPAS